MYLLSESPVKSSLTIVLETWDCLAGSLVTSPTALPNNPVPPLQDKGPKMWIYIRVSAGFKFLKQHQRYLYPTAWGNSFNTMRCRNSSTVQRSLDVQSKEYQLCKGLNSLKRETIFAKIKY